MLLISFIEVALAATKVISEIEPMATGVRIDTPSNLPSNWGRAFVVAMAAPVDEGTRFIAAARPILGSLLDGASMRDWEAV